jgi:Tfp pilus assembly protein PilE
MNKINLQSGRSLLALCAAVTPCIFERRVQKRYTSEKMPSQCPQKGRSMIEMLGVLAIIGALSVGGIMGYSKAMMRYKINKTIEQITYIAGNVRTTFANQGNYDGLTDYTSAGLNLIKKAKLVPDEMMILDANGNLKDSGVNAANFKTVQTAVADIAQANATAEVGSTIYFLSGISQNTNGVISATKKKIDVATDDDIRAIFGLDPVSNS